MSLYKRKDSPDWWVKLAHNGRLIQQSAGISDKAKAREYHDKLKAYLWEQERLGVKPRHLWQDAALRYLNETTYKASQDSDKARLRWLDTFLRDVALTDIKRDLLEKVIAAKLQTGVTPAGVNRVLQIDRAVLRKAVKIEGAVTNPLRAIK